MATSLAKSRIFFALFLLSVAVNFVTGLESYDYIEELNPYTLDQLMHKQKLTHLRVFWQEIVVGPNPSGIFIYTPPGPNPFAFGVTRIIDDSLTIGPEVGSRTVGKAQGIYSRASQGEMAFVMVQNFVLTEGKYNGSTISIMGRNPVFSSVREMPIVGGSGAFRSAKGYVLATTSMLNSTTGDATVEYNCYIYHF